MAAVVSFVSCVSPSGRACFFPFLLFTNWESRFRFLHTVFNRRSSRSKDGCNWATSFRSFCFLWDSGFFFTSTLGILVSINVSLISIVPSFLNYIIASILSLNFWGSLSVLRLNKPCFCCFNVRRLYYWLRRARWWFSASWHVHFFLSKDSARSSTCWLHWVWSSIQ